jgi:putative type I restriction enzyme specificity protein HI_0216
MLLSEEYLNKISAKINGLVSKDYELKLTTLGEIGEIQMCKRILKEQTSSQGEVPFYKIGTFGKEADSFISQDLFREYREKYNYPKNGEILLSASGTIGKTVIFDGEDAYFQDSNIVWISHNERLVLNKYLYYFYQIVKWNPSTGGTINRLYNYNLKNIKITLPPIEIQNKVVEILDKFQSLLADTKGLLPQEIEQRQKQYEFYREKLLTFNENSAKHTHTHNLISNSYFDLLKEAASISNVKLFEVEWKVLGSIGVFENGTGMPKSLFDETGSVGAIHYGHIYTKYNLFVNQPIVRVTKKNAKNLKVVNKGDLVIAKTSENIEDVMKTVAYLGEEYAVTGGHSAIFRHKENPKYLSYVFNGAKYLLRQKNKLARGVKVIELSTTDMEKIKIPVPPIKVQEHIVEILDKFDAIVNDISKGLPKEIALRQKQYEYYREKLLSFEK